MITMTMTRQAAEAVRDAISLMPCGAQTNVEAYQAVVKALERDAAERWQAVVKGVAAQGVSEVDQAIKRKLWGGDGVVGATGIRDVRLWVGLIPEDLAQLRTFIEGLLPWKHHIPFCERMLKALEEVR